ncbi:shikimate dehydrogenase family protein [Zafaria sp. J156]|uniref:shikimate dehydrogenase family protein n=1 Tax=Zafaria sp. J156 TaxID=3116490 RepID=UPI002E77E2D6|nr:shikimate dehydrogenase [Zafaria sp. J156]MEE1621120.1 shikimate dehydrogenase [Zafaria sp. J156]
MSGARAAVVGQPIGHSRSPVLHRAAYAHLGLPIGYDAIDAGVPDAAELAARLRGEAGWRGLSVTMPLKHALVPHMDSVSDRVRRLGALNTVVVRPGTGGPSLHGENTDVDGIVRALGVEPDPGLRIAVLGAGGTAAAAAEAAATLGAAATYFVVRDTGRAADAVGLARGLGLSSEAIGTPEASERLPGYGVVISTLPPGAADPWSGALPLQAMRPGSVLLDVAYDPWPSRLATAWAAAGGRVVDGLEMLLHQAVEQVLLFTGTDPGRRTEVTNVMYDAVGLPRPVR